jgi:hypothetical protein
MQDTDLRITTNHVPRDVIDAWELSPAERAEFDYIDWPAVEDGRESASFIRYRGDLVDLGEFMRVEGAAPLDGWDGYSSDSFFSGLVVRFVDDGERVIVGRYIA